MKSEAEILCIPRLHVRRFSVFGALIFIVACAAEGGCVRRQPAARFPLALASRASQTQSSPSDAAKRLDKEAQRLLKDMQKHRASAGPSADAIPGSVGTVGRVGEIGNTATSTMGDGAGMQPPASANDIGVGTGPFSGQVPGKPDSPARRTSPFHTALLAGALAALGAVAAAGVVLVMRRRA